MTSGVIDHSPLESDRYTRAKDTPKDTLKDTPKDTPKLNALLRPMSV